MQRFKSIILPMQGKNKSGLHWLYNTRSDIEPPKIFTYCSLRFWFGGTGYRNTEKLVLYVEIPTSFTSDLFETSSIPVENYMLCVLSPVINDLSLEYISTVNNVREKVQFAAQATNQIMLRRSGIHYDCEKGSVVLTVHFNVPLVNALSVNAKSAVRAVKDILDHIESVVKNIDLEKFNQYISVYKKQQEIREFLKSSNYCAFIANGSILPRENATDFPMINAIPFISPLDMCITIPFSDRTEILGMGIKKGVTVITGGGYSGKSTLLDAIEMGIYNHIPGDGREFVITDDSALKIYAEDGRPVHSLNLLPFFRRLPGDSNVSCFSTLHASGSVSQAANIIEAICGKSTLLLIDEDKSATNFMIRDKIMKLVVEREPIIPFTDRVRELYENNGVSTILVIGGSSEYLSYADTVILMDDYIAKDITGKIYELGLTKQVSEELPAVFEKTRYIKPLESSQPFRYFKSVETENEKKIILDDYSANITLLTAIITSAQMNTLLNCLVQILADKDADNDDILNRVTFVINKMFSDSVQTASLLPELSQRWYEEIRTIDAFCCINRMRGIDFIGEKNV